jgi:hypothetical protein
MSKPRNNVAIAQRVKEWCDNWAWVCSNIMLFLQLIAVIVSAIATVYSANATRDAYEIPLQLSNDERYRVLSDAIKRDSSDIKRLKSLSGNSEQAISREVMDNYLQLTSSILSSIDIVSNCVYDKKCDANNNILHDRVCTALNIVVGAQDGVKSKVKNDADIIANHCEQAKDASEIFSCGIYFIEPIHGHCDISKKDYPVVSSGGSARKGN